MSEEYIESGGVKVLRVQMQEYRKAATVRAGMALSGGVIPTLEGPHSYEAFDYICGPGAAGEFWPVKRAIFEATYEPVTSEPPLSVRTFVLRRTNDVSGISGLGDVAEGIVFTDGTTVLRWLRAGGSTAIYDSLDRMKAIHGHDGGTEVVFTGGAS